MRTNKIELGIKPVISNVVSTSNLHQRVDVVKFQKYGWGMYDPKTYGGKCGYVKSCGMKGRVIIFPSGKMISVGAKSVKKAAEQLNEAKLCLVQESLTLDVKLTPVTQNIVATITFPTKLKINQIFTKLAGAIYEPEQFPGLILKSMKSVSYIIFGSGKIVLTGAKSKNELLKAASEIEKKLKLYNK